MPTEVIMPRVDMDMAVGKVAHWYVKNGERVRKGQTLFEIETDKATMEVDSTADGIMHGIHGEIGVEIPVGQVIGWILAPGEAAPTAASTEAPAAASHLAVAANSPTVEPTASETITGAMKQAPADRGLLRASPLARSLARQHGIDLTSIAGGGPNGRVLGRDVLQLLDDTGDARPSQHHDLNLQWARRGRGTPLLLIHGFGADQGSWRPLVQRLPEGRPVVAIDLPNHGKSVVRPVESLQQMAREVLERLDQEGLGACDLLGHSLGGGVALALAQLAPARVRSLTLIAPAGLGPDINATFIDGLVRADDEAALKTAMTSLFHDPAGLTGSFVATAFQQLQVPQRRAALTAMAAQLMPHGRQSRSMRDALQEVRVPVQIIWGTSDRIIPMHHALDVPGHVGVHLLPAVGHLPQVEAVSLVALLVSHQSGSVAEQA